MAHSRQTATDFDRKIPQQRAMAAMLLANVPHFWLNWVSPALKLPLFQVRGAIRGCDPHLLAGCQLVQADALTENADYVAIRDSSFKLELGETQAYTFNLPVDIVVSGSSKRPVVAFVADPSSNANGLDCRISLNNVSWKVQIFRWCQSWSLGNHQTFELGGWQGKCHSIQS